VKLIVLVMLLAGRASVRMPVDSTTIIGEHGRMTLVAEEIATGGDLRERLAHELGCASIEKLAAARSGVAYGAAPRLPRIVDRRALVYVAYAAAHRGPAIALRFYVDDDGFDYAPEWARSAHDITQTLELDPEPLPVTEREPHPAPEMARSAMPRECGEWHDEGITRPTAASDARYEDSTLPAYWAVWSDKRGHHAEIIVHRDWGSLVIRCRAKTAGELAKLRARAEAALK
jgi:hypothetical protein